MAPVAFHQKPYRDSIYRLMWSQLLRMWPGPRYLRKIISSDATLTCNYPEWCCLCFWYGRLEISGCMPVWWRVVEKVENYTGEVSVNLIAICVVILCLIGHFYLRMHLALVHNEVNNMAGVGSVCVREDLSLFPLRRSNVTNSPLSLSPFLPLSLSLSLSLPPSLPQSSPSFLPLPSSSNPFLINR